MELTKACGGTMAVLVAAMMVMMVANETHAQIYACWGGCYNKCIFGGMSPSNGSSNFNGSSNSNGTSTADPPTTPPPQPQPHPLDTSTDDSPPPPPPPSPSPPPPQPRLPPQPRPPRQPPQGMIPCYYQCLNGCVPRSARDYGYYCHLGCTLNRCPPNSTYDGAELEKCYGTCVDLCKNM